jgi:hypothetical protein
MPTTMGTSKRGRYLLPPLLSLVITATHAETLR